MNKNTFESKFSFSNFMKNVFGINTQSWWKRIKYLIYTLIFIAILCGVFYVNRSSFRRSVKSFTSNIMDGLERKVTLYSYDGKEIKSWKGRFDTAERSETNPGEVMFDMKDGRRVIITGGIVVNETF